MTHLSHTWKQRGSISLWRYTENERNFPGWHLSADGAGCDSLAALVDSLAKDGVPVSRSVELTPPTPALLAIPNNRRGTAKYVAPFKLRVSFVSDPSSWLFPEHMEPAELSFGHDWLVPLVKGINGIPLGQGDYCIGSDLPLWFWWRTGTV